MKDIGAPEQGNVSQNNKKKTLKKVLIGAGCVAVAVLLFFSGFFVSRLSMDKGLRSLLWFKENIQDDYYQEISDEEFWDAAISGVEEILDDYSRYYSADEYDAVISSNKGIKSGVGLGFFTGTNQIYQVVIGSPVFLAQSAQGERAEAGMYLTGIGKSENEIVDTFDFDAMTTALSDIKTGERVWLRFSDRAADDSQNCFVLNVEKKVYTESYILYATNRATYIEVFDENSKNGVWTKVGDGMDLLAEGEGYIKFTQFNGNAAEEFKNAAMQYKSDGCDVLLLDIRDNGGGNLKVLQAIASYLMKDAQGKSVVLYSVNKKGREEYLSYGNYYGDYFAGSKIYVTANENSASASEALLGAMLSYGTISYDDLYLTKTQAHQDALAKTYGKGIMQTTVRSPLTGEAVKLTTAKIYWPDGTTCIQGRGITAEDGAKTVVSNYDGDHDNSGLKQILADIRA